MPRVDFSPMIFKRVKPPEPGPAGEVRRVDLWDASHPAFGCRLSSTGACSWQLLRRVNRGGKRVLSRVRLGRFRILRDGRVQGVTLAQARAEADRVGREIDDGADPLADRRETRREAVAAYQRTYEWAAGEYVNRWAEGRQKTWKETKRVLLTDCAKLKPRPIGSITKAEIYDLLEGPGFKQDGKEAKAALAYRHLKTFFRYAAHRDWVSAPIVDGVKLDFAVAPRTRVLTDEELTALWAAAGELVPHDGAFLRLLILTGVRVNELAGMRWQEMDDTLIPTLWTVPHERTKSKKTAKTKRVYIVPLSPLARDVLKGLPRTNTGLCFPGRSGDKPFRPGSKLKAAIVAKSGVKDFTYHQTRHAIASWLESQGFDEYDRGLALNHAGSGSVTAGYSHSYAVDRKRQVMDKWGAHVGALASGKTCAARTTAAV